MPQTKLYIGNLPENIDKSELQQLFQKYGNVVEFDILKEYGFIHYEQESEAKAAAAALDGHEYRGNNMKVEVSRSKVRQRAGMGGKGECYRCGGEGHWSKECPKGPSRDNRRGSSRFGGSRMRGGGGGGYDDGPGRDPYYPPDPYDYYRSRMLYDRYRYDPYERRLPPLPRDPYRDPYRPSADYYRPRSPMRDMRDYDYYYDRRRSEMQNGSSGYGGAGYWGGSDRMPGGAAGAVDDMKSSHRGQLQARVPGPY